MADGRMLLHEAGVRWTFNPAQPRVHGKWAGPSVSPGELQAKAAAAYEKVHGKLAEIRLGPGDREKLEGIVREHLAKEPGATAARVKERMKAQGHKVEGEPGGFSYSHINEVVKKVKAEAKAPEAKAPVGPPELPKTPAPGVPTIQDLTELEENAYQDAKKKGLSHYSAHSQRDWNAEQAENEVNAAVARGLTRYINERQAEHDQLVATRQAAMQHQYTGKGWKHFTPDEVLAYYRGMSKTFPTLADVGKQFEAARGTNISLLAGGSRLIYKMPLAPTPPPASAGRKYVVLPEQQRVLEQEVEKARRTHPNQPPLTVTVGQAATGGKFPTNVWGQTYTGTGKMFLAPQIFGRNADKLTEASVAAGHWMPAYTGAGAIRGVFSHELGHTLDAFEGNGNGTSHKSGPATKEARKVSSGMSSYGRKNTAEAFAEAFAEWHLSNGKTTNPIVRRIAETEGWAADTRMDARARAFWLRSLAGLRTPACA